MIAFTSELPLKNLTPDSGIITISKNDKRIVITKDSDFYHSYILKKEPFKILFVRVGNLRSINLIALFNLNFENIIKKFKTGSIVEMTLDEIRILY